MDSYQQHGGRLLGEGAFGCTFEPAPRCVGGKVFKTIGGRPAVGKITTEASTSELAMGRMLMSGGTGLESAYFAVATESCKPSRPILDPEVADCDIVKTTTENVPLNMLIMPAAGIEFTDWIQNEERLATHLRHVFVHLLEGIRLYQKKGIVHNDIHMGNILVDEHNVARLIDFGLSFKIDDVREWRDTKIRPHFSPRYIYAPPEVHTIRMSKSGVRLRDGVAQLMLLHYEYDSLVNMFPRRMPLGYALEEFVTESPYFRRGDDRGFVREYGMKFDSWRIGLCMFKAWRRIRNRPAGSQEIMRAIEGLTEFNPMRRWSAEQALRSLDPHNPLA
jgi:serine/threonine protein kinase